MKKWGFRTFDKFIYLTTLLLSYLLKSKYSRKKFNDCIGSEPCHCYCIPLQFMWDHNWTVFHVFTVNYLKEVTCHDLKKVCREFWFNIHLFIRRIDVVHVYLHLLHNKSYLKCTGFANFAKWCMVPIKRFIWKVLNTCVCFELPA